MSIQKSTLRLVLGMIGAAAVCCIAGLAVGGISGIFGAIACSIGTAVAAGIILLLGRLAANENWRRFALTAMAFTLFELALSYVLFFVDFSGGYRLADAVAQIAGAGLLAAGPVLLAMRFWGLPRFDVAARIAVMGASLGFLACFIAAVGSSSAIGNALWPMAVLLTVLGTMVGLCFARGGVSDSTSSFVRLISAISALTAMYFAASVIWKESPLKLHIFWICGAITVWLAHFNLMHLCRLSDRERPVRWIAIVLVGCAGVVINVCLWRESAVVQMVPTQNQFGLERFAAGVAIAAAAATLAVFILSIRGVLQKPVQVRAPAFATLAVTCPNCSKAQTFPTPHARCGDCGMQFELRVIEPRCGGCDYLLLMYEGDRCPECGLPILRPPGPVSATPSEAELNRIALDGVV